MQRVCHGCVNSNKSKESSADPTAGAASSKRLRPERQETGKEKQAGALDSLKRVGNTAARKARGADTRKRPTFEQQVEALDLLKNMRGKAIAARLNVVRMTTRPTLRRETRASARGPYSLPVRHRTRT